MATPPQLLSGKWGESIVQETIINISSAVILDNRALQHSCSIISFLDYADRIFKAPFYKCSVPNKILQIETSKTD
jgi:hypothetical protein